MGNVETSLELENVNGPTLAAEPAQTRRYSIACGSGIYRRRDEYRARSFEAVGEMVLVDDQVQIRASAARLFKAKIAIDLRFGLHDIFNVVASGKLVRFEAAGEDGRLRMVLCVRKAGVRRVKSRHGYPTPRHQHLWRNPKSLKVLSTASKLLPRMSG